MKTEIICILYLYLYYIMVKNELTSCKIRNDRNFMSRRNIYVEMHISALIES